MLDLDLEPVCRLVGLAAQFEQPWDAEQVSSKLVRSGGGEPVGSVSLPYPKRLGRDDLLLGIEYDYEDLVIIGVALKESPLDGDSHGHSKAVVEEYEGSTGGITWRLLGQGVKIRRPGPRGGRPHAVHGTTGAGQPWNPTRAPARRPETAASAVPQREFLALEGVEEGGEGRGGGR